MLNKVPADPIEYVEDIGGGQAPSIDFVAIFAGVLRRWKLIAAITLFVSIATYGMVKLLVPSVYKSTVEILVYDPQRQIDESVQKPISLFIDAVGNDAMSTEINVLRSKSVALRVVKELGLDSDPDFQSHAFGIRDLLKQVGLGDFLERLGFPALGGSTNEADSADDAEDKTEREDQAADALLKKLEIWQESYIIFVTASSRDPAKAQRLASTIADDYLASQREARQESLDHVATWLKGRVDDLQSRVLERESAIEKLKAESGIPDTEVDKAREQQTGSLNAQLMTARSEVNDLRARLEQARSVIASKGSIESIPEMSGSAMLSELRRKEMELNWSVAELQSKVGEGNSQVMSIRAELASVTKQMNAEAEHIIDTMKNAYDVAVRREQSLEANIAALNDNLNSGTYVKLQELERVADADRKAYEAYLSQYNDIAERRLLQDASARIISPAALPRRPAASRMKFYAIGGIAGLAGGLLLAFALEFFRPGIKTSTEIEQSVGVPVVGNIPLVSGRKPRGVSYGRPLDRMFNEPMSQLSEAVHTMRISLELWSANPKVILVTSAVAGEGKSTTAMLLAASSAGAGKKTLLLDCDLRLRSVSQTLGNKHQLGLSELLRGTADLNDMIIQDPITKIYLLPAGSVAPNTADLLMSREMLDLVATLRDEFDYIVMDAPPLLPVVDALALAASADKILVVVEWCGTSRASILEAFKILGPEVNRVAGIVLNKVDFDRLPGYGGHKAEYYYQSAARSLENP